MVIKPRKLPSKSFSFHLPINCKHMHHFIDDFMYVVGCKLDGLPPHLYEQQAAELRAIIQETWKRIKVLLFSFTAILFIVAVALLILVFFILSNIPYDKAASF